MRCAVVTLQCRLRCKRAKKKLKDLRTAAKDLGVLQQSNEALKREIRDLQAKAAEETRRLKLEMENRMVSHNAAQLQAKVDALTEELRLTRAALEEEKALRIAVEKELEETGRQLISVRNELGNLKLKKATEKVELGRNDGGGSASLSPINRTPFRRASGSAVVVHSSGRAKSVEPFAAERTVRPAGSVSPVRILFEQEMILKQTWKDVPNSGTMNRWIPCDSVAIPSRFVE